MAVDFSIIGERIKKARKAKKMTQEDLAEKMDVSIAFLSRIERGTSQINLKRLSQVCNILDEQLVVLENILTLNLLLY